MPANTFEQIVSDYIDKLLASAAKGMTLSDFLGGLMDVGKEASTAAALYLANVGARKKEAVKAAIMQAFDAFWPLFAIKAPWLAMLIRPFARQAVSAALDSAVERLYQWVVKPNLPLSE